MLFTLVIALCMAGEPDCTEAAGPTMTEAECMAKLDPATQMLAAEVIAAGYDREVTIYVACVEQPI